MTFADITVVPVPGDREEIYREFSERMSQVYRDHGATRIVDYWQDSPSADQSDLHADGASHDPGQLRSIGAIAGASEREAVVVTVTEWPSRQARDRGVAAATKDPRVTATLSEAPVFDGSRLAGGSFDVTMDLHDAI